MTPQNASDEFDILFELLGNRTRFDILRRLAREPMYLGQLSRELEVHQQAILRHLEKLHEEGLLDTYEDESIRGPPRKYYRVSKAVRLTVHITPGGVRVIRIVPDKRRPKTIEDVIRRGYPELFQFVSQVQRLPQIYDQLDRKRAAIDLIQHLEGKMEETQEIGKFLKTVISYLRKEYL